ncbi:MAG: twin-arginine translocation signal domain-containing protein [Granulosicoccus sp.]
MMTHLAVSALIDFTTAEKAMQSRRRFLKTSLATMSAAGLPISLHGMGAWAADSNVVSDGVRSVALGDTTLLLLSDGHMQLPVSMILPDSIDAQERDAVFAQYQLDKESVQPPCNITLWQTGDRTILFDTGGGQGCSRLH